MHDGCILKVSKKDTTSEYFFNVIMPNLNRCLPTGAQLCSFPVSKNLFKVRKIALEQKSDDRCSNVINIAEFEQVFARTSEQCFPAGKTLLKVSKITPGIFRLGYDCCSTLACVLPNVNYYTKASCPVGKTCSKSAK